MHTVRSHLGKRYYRTIPGPRTGSRRHTGVGAEVDRELAGVAAGVGADLALEGPLVVVDAEVLLQTAAVGRRVRTVFALVRLLPRVRAAVHVEFVAPAEALVAQLTLKRLLALRNKNNSTGRFTPYYFYKNTLEIFRIG